MQSRKKKTDMKKWCYNHFWNSNSLNEFGKIWSECFVVTNTTKSCFLHSMEPQKRAVDFNLIQGTAMVVHKWWCTGERLLSVETRWSCMQKKYTFFFNDSPKLPWWPFSVQHHFVQVTKQCCSPITEHCCVHRKNLEIQGASHQCLRQFELFSNI